MDKEEISITNHPMEEGQYEDKDPALPARYMGTSADKRDMTILGKKQVLRVCIPGSSCIL